MGFHSQCSAAEMEWNFADAWDFPFLSDRILAGGLPLGSPELELG